MSSFAYQSDDRFLKVPVASGREPYAVAGIAWDGSTTNRPGARFGPRAIRQASHMLCDGVHPLFDVTPDGHLGDAGDLPLPNTSLAGMRQAMEPLVDTLIRRHHMAWLGGDHSITLPLLRCYRRWLGRPLAVIHFDAHCDTWDDHFGEPSGHGTWVYEAMQEGLVLDACFMQVGIRSAGVREAREYVRQRGGLIFDARSLRGLESAEQLAPVLGAIRERLAAHGHPPVYLTLDIDALDPAFAPGTGTPEPGGLTTNQIF
ncbi:MAG: arginase family protein, partial [Rubrivivax sp.]|nr:arginase family protein [Rubrivivax sp.]